MSCLKEHLGVVEAECFVVTVIREKFDNTRWQREYFDKVSPEEISQEAEKFGQNEPYTENAVRP